MFMLMDAWEDKPFYLDGKVIIADRKDDLDELTSWFGLNDFESPVRVVSSVGVPYITFSQAWDCLEALK